MATVAAAHAAVCLIISACTAAANSPSVEMMHAVGKQAFNWCNVGMLVPSLGATSKLKLSISPCDKFACDPGNPTGTIAFDQLCLFYTRRMALFIAFGKTSIVSLPAAALHDIVWLATAKC
jgi:hypothetical protein